MSQLHAALRFANQLEPRPLRWLWPTRIPLSRLTLLVGEPGVGKSLLIADLAARLSAAMPWPVSPLSPALRGEGRGEGQMCVSDEPTIRESLPAGVILACPEDGIASTLVPRLFAAGADPSRICFLEGARDDYLQSIHADPSTPECLRASVPSCLPLSLPAHADVLAQAIRAVDHPALVAIDPLHAVLDPAADSAIGALQLVAALNTLAARSGVAILAVCHLIKTRSARVLYRVRGSLALLAAARSVLLLAADPHDPDRRILAPLKTIYGPPAPPLAFRITSQCVAPCVPPVSAPRLAWEPACPQAGLPLDLLDLTPDAHSAFTEACDWLTAALAAGPRPVADLLRESRAAGITIGTLRRAKRALAVHSARLDRLGPWSWCLPESATVPNGPGAQLRSAQP